MHNWITMTLGNRIITNQNSYKIKMAYTKHLSVEGFDKLTHTAEKVEIWIADEPSE